MKMNPDFDRHAAAWLADGPTELADRVLDAALAEVRLTRQRRRWSTSWRTPTMRLSLRLVAAIAVVAVVGYAGLSIRNPLGGVGSLPSPSPSDPPIGPVPTAVPLDTSRWTVYVSGRNWLSIEHPADWTERFATTTYAPETSTWDSNGVDTFISPGDQIRVSAFSAPIKSGTSLEAWIQTYCQKNSQPCTGIQDRAEPVFAGSDRAHPGLLVPFATDMAAFFPDTDRIYVVQSWRPDGQFDSRRILEAMIGTLCFDCSSPAGSTPRPS